MTVNLFLGDCIEICRKLIGEQLTVDLAYCDPVYELKDFDYIFDVLQLLSPDGILIVQTDHHTLFEYGTFLKSLKLEFVNHLVEKNEWGNHPKDRFHQSFDNLLIFCKSKHWTFDSSKVQVPKATVNTKLNPSGRLTKTATAFIDDICLTTTSKERVKKEDGKLIRWQKPLKLFDRVIAPWVTEKSIIYDPFCGSGSLAVWSYRNKLDYFGSELDPEVYNLAVDRLKAEKTDTVEDAILSSNA
jgi:DNA modification methylase